MKKDTPALHRMEYVIQNFKQVSRIVKTDNDVSVAIIIKGSFIFGTVHGATYVVLAYAVPESRLFELNSESNFLLDESCFPPGGNNFLLDESYFLLDESSFLLDESSFLLDESCFLLGLSK
ncbi:hypothetical protein ACYULU_07310 [Breznakiellaceae bacterium SP9]